MRKQDRQGVRSPADLERKYNFDKNFSDSTAMAHEANQKSAEAYQAVADLDRKLNQAELVNRLTKYGESIAIVLIEGDIFINAANVLYSEGVTIKDYVDSIEAQSAYTAMMTDTISGAQALTKEKIAYWYTAGLWSYSMVYNAIEKAVLTEAEAKEILG